MGAGLSVPFGMGTGTQTELTLTILLTAALSGLLFLDIFSLRRTTFIRARPIWPLFALIGATLVMEGFGSHVEKFWHNFLCAVGRDDLIDVDLTSTDADAPRRRWSS